MSCDGSTPKDASDRDFVGEGGRRILEDVLASEVDPLLRSSDAVSLNEKQSRRRTVRSARAAFSWDNRVWLPGVMEGRKRSPDARMRKSGQTSSGWPLFPNSGTDSRRHRSEGSAKT